MSNALIIADGSPLLKNQIAKLRRKRFCIALDGAADRARKENWAPDLILGDLDTLSPTTIRYFVQKSIPFLQTPDQNFTDLEKALAWCALENFSSIWIAQGWGLRMDHSLANLSLLKKYSPSAELILFTETEKVRFVKNRKIYCSGKKARRVAIMPFPKCQVKSRGLAYELDSLALEIGKQDSVSNMSIYKTFTLDIEGDALLIEDYEIS